MKNTSFKAIGQYSPTPQNPSYGGGGTVSGGQSGTSPAPSFSNTSGANANWAYSVSGANAAAVMSNAQIMATLAPEPYATMGLSDDNVFLKFNTWENQAVVAQYEPDPSLTVRDFSKIMMMLVLVENGGVSDRSKIMSYLRAHNLEKHFKFTA